MVCSICGFAGHNKVTCARRKAQRICEAVLDYGTEQIIARGLDAVCPGLGLTYEAYKLTMAILKARKNGVDEKFVFDALMDLNG